MNFDPIAGLSDQRYFHAALLIPHKSAFSPAWLWENVRKDAGLGAGRYRRRHVDGGTFEFRTLEESNLYAGSLPAREALAVSKTCCAYDMFLGSVSGMLAVGTGYAALTRLIIARLIRRELLSRVYFLVPKIPEIIGTFRNPMGNSGLPVKFTVTAFSASLPGKAVKSLRLGGNDVFGSGLVDHIESWLEANHRAEADDGKNDGPPTQPFSYEAVRLKAVGNLTGAAASVILAKDGGCKFWLRKEGGNIPEFAGAVSTLQRLRRFETSAEPPKWSEELEV